MPAFAAAVARTIAKATTRKKDAAEETGVAEGKVYPPPLAVGLRSESTVREYDTIEALGQVWAVGLMWSDGDIEREEALHRARARSANPERQEARAGPALDLIIVRPIGVGETEHFYEQYGLARAVRGRVERGTCSLGAHIASQWKTGSVAGLFRIEPEAVYLIVVQEGVIRPGSDRCYASYADAMNEFLPLVKMMSRSEWRVVLSPGDKETSIPALAERGVPVEHCELVHLLSLVLSLDDPVPVLRTVHFQVPRKVKFVGAIALVAALPAGFLWGFDFGSLTLLNEIREILERRAAAPVVTEVTTEEAFVSVPWENSIHEPGEWLMNCVSGIEQVPMAVAPERYVAGESAFREVVSVACDGSRTQVLRDSFIATDSGFGRKSSEQFAFGGRATANNGAAWRGFAPVVLDSVAGMIEVDDEQRDEAIKEEVRKVLMEVVDGIGSATMHLIGGEVHPGVVVTGALDNSTELAWATLGFQITAGNIALSDARRWHDVLVEAKAVQFADVLWSPGSGWVLNAFVAGMTNRASEAVRAEAARTEADVDKRADLK